MHVRIVQMLDNRPNDPADSDNLAQHALHSVGLIDDQQVENILLRAAQDANADNRSRDALSWCDELRALGLARNGIAAAMFAEQRGLAHYRLNLREEAFQSFRDSFHSYEAAGCPEDAIRVVSYPLAVYWKSELIQLLEDALQIAPENSLEKATLLSRHGMAVGQAGRDIERASQSFRSATRIQRNLGENDLLLWTCTRASAVYRDHLLLESALEYATEALELGIASSDPEAIMYSHDRASQV